MELSVSKQIEHFLHITRLVLLREFESRNQQQQQQRQRPKIDSSVEFTLYAAKENEMRYKEPKWRYLSAGTDGMLLRTDAFRVAPNAPVAPNARVAKFVFAGHENGAFVLREMWLMHVFMLFQLPFLSPLLPGRFGAWNYPDDDDDYAAARGRRDTAPNNLPRGSIALGFSDFTDVLPNSAAKFYRADNRYKSARALFVDEKATFRAVGVYESEYFAGGTFQDYFEYALNNGRYYKELVAIIFGQLDRLQRADIRFVHGDLHLRNIVFQLVAGDEFAPPFHQFTLRSGNQGRILRPIDTKHVVPRIIDYGRSMLGFNPFDRIRWWYNQTKPAASDPTEHHHHHHQAFVESLNAPERLAFETNLIERRQSVSRFTDIHRFAITSAWHLRTVVAQLAREAVRASDRPKFLLAIRAAANEQIVDFVFALCAPPAHWVLDDPIRRANVLRERPPAFFFTKFTSNCAHEYLTRLAIVSAFGDALRVALLQPPQSLADADFVGIVDYLRNAQVLAVTYRVLFLLLHDLNVWDVGMQHIFDLDGDYAPSRVRNEAPVLHSHAVSSVLNWSWW